MIGLLGLFGATNASAATHNHKASTAVHKVSKSASAISSVPGTRTSPVKGKVKSSVISSPTALSPFVTDTGQVSLSSDGLGSNDASGGPINVQKNAGATVKAAYLFAASTGGSGYVPQDGDVTLDGTAIDWNPAETIQSNIGSYNAEADVTSIVKPVVDAAPTGLVSFTVAEGSETYNYDGEALEVILNDPTAPTDNTVSILYGAQYTAGDSFNINLGTPIDTSLPGLALTMGLGDSYGYQTETYATGQYSILTVNGQPLSSSAGGQDDCVEKYAATPDYGDNCPNGTLITVGGIGDSTANPPDPSATDATCGPPAAPRCDDELYNLVPFVKNGDTTINVTTQNPSNNDNIFLATLDLTDTTAVIGQGITLSPPSATQTTGGSDTVTAKVVDGKGNGVSGQAVSFKIIAGPDAGKTGSGGTGPSGTAPFTFSNTGGVGTDQIQASFTSSTSETFTSNIAKVSWTSPSKNTDTVTLHFGSAPTYEPQSPVAPSTGVSLEATVNPNGVVNPGNKVTAPTGTITFSDGTTPIATVPVNGYLGSAYAADLTSKLTTGSHEITAKYNGDANYPATVSNQVQVTVATGAKGTATDTPTTVGLDFGSMPTYTEQSPVSSGNAELFAVTVSKNWVVKPGGSVVAPTGTVSFYDGTTYLGKATLSSTLGSGYASFATSSLPKGSNEITAVYSGDGTHPASTSNQVQVTVS
jgi:hypothetical protein